MMLFGIVVLLFLSIIGILYLIPGYTSPIKDLQGHTLQGSIASLEKIKHNGTRETLYQ